MEASCETKRSKGEPNKRATETCARSIGAPVTESRISPSMLAGCSFAGVRAGACAKAAAAATQRIALLLLGIGVLLGQQLDVAGDAVAFLELDLFTAGKDLLERFIFVIEIHHLERV